MRARPVAAAVVVLLLVVVSVQVVDPRLNDRRPPAVDFDDPPAEVAADAAKRFEYVDYAYRFDIKYGPNPNWRQVRMMQVDNTDRTFYKEGPLGEDGVVMYGTDAVTYVRPGEDAAWRVTGMREVIFNRKTIAQQFLVERIRRSSATVVDENSSTVVIHVDVHPVKVAPRFPGNATLFVSKGTGLIHRASIVFVTPNGPKYLKFYLLNQGNDLERPDDLPISSRAIAWDVSRGPIVNL